MRRRSLITLTLCATFAFTVSGVACTFGTDCDFGKCEGPKVGAESPDGSSTDGGADVDASPIPPGCDLTKDPKDSPKCIDEDAGVFVSPTGKPGAAGTRTDPVGSITDALPKLDGPKGRIPRIYVCAGDYSENVSVSTKVDIFGGLDCASWAPGAAKPKFTAKAPGDFALKITGARDISITDVAFAAQAAGQSAANSIAAFVTEASGNVRFARVDLAALEGANGATPAAPGADGAVVAGDLLGNNAGDPATTSGGKEKVCACVGGKTSTGGKGGDNGQVGAAGKETILPPMPAAATGAGGTGNSCGTGLGKDGSDAPNASDADAALGLGDLDTTGWTARPGAKGLDALAGQGGGGGLGFGGGGGGSGGCGGCPGLGGEGGKGGGASIALLVFNSPNVSVSSTTLSSKKAGDGGSGVGGGTGIGGGFGGNPQPGGCQGGRGGMGGNGGAGAGGAGGVSVGILYKGPKPTSEGVTFTGGTKGGPGGGPGKPGPDGQAAQELEIK
ncbi:MAG: hypothetical protein R3B36_22655 [Polyangiaceae bacterium]